MLLQSFHFIRLPDDAMVATKARLQVRSKDLGFSANKAAPKRQRLVILGVCSAQTIYST